MPEKRVRLKVGDIFEIPLSDGRKACGQYVFADPKWGPMIQVFDLITEQRIRVEQLRKARPLFRPVITGLRAAVRERYWSIIGHLSVGGFTYPKFISPLIDHKTETLRTWYLWDGEEFLQLGRKLPEEYRHLEQLVVWDPHDVTHRIETGENPLDYRLDL